MKKKPDTPRPDFPLFAHACGQWVKKINGRLHYFGTWDNPQAALDKYLSEKDARQAGKVPKQKEDVTVALLINSFLNSKKQKLDDGELSPRTFSDDYRACVF